MQIKLDQLSNRLASTLVPVFLIHGDETLLVEEAASNVRQAVREAGASEREVWHVEGRFDWSQIKWHEQTLSLFASHRLIEIRLPNGSPGKDGGEKLRQFATDLPADTTLVIISGKIDARSQKSKWFVELDAVGVNVPVWPVEASQMPNWIRQRMQQRGLPTDLALATMIAERVEGNLFAAAQEVEKLALLHLDEAVDSATVLASVADNARFEAFGLMDAVLLGHSDKIPRMIQRLKAEGVEMLAVFSAVSWSLHRVIDMALQLQQGQAMERVFASQKPPVWDKNKPVMRAALQRYDGYQWQRFALQLSEIDQAAKGMLDQSAWRLLEKLCLQASGIQMPQEPKFNEGVQR